MRKLKPGFQPLFCTLDGKVYFGHKQDVRWMDVYGFSIGDVKLSNTQSKILGDE